MYLECEFMDQIQDILDSIPIDVSVQELICFTSSQVIPFVCTISQM